MIVPAWLALFLFILLGAAWAGDSNFLKAFALGVITALLVQDFARKRGWLS